MPQRVSRLLKQEVGNTERCSGQSYPRVLEKMPEACSHREEGQGSSLGNTGPVLKELSHTDGGHSCPCSCVQPQCTQASVSRIMVPEGAYCNECYFILQRTTPLGLGLHSLRWGDTGSVPAFMNVLFSRLEAHAQMGRLSSGPEVMAMEPLPSGIQASH